jgi:hypothetical protein
LSLVDLRRGVSGSGHRPCHGVGPSETAHCRAAMWDRSAIGPSLPRRWLNEASQTLEQAVAGFAERPLRSGLYGLTSAFFRLPFVRINNAFVAISPWHLHDFANLGTREKLRQACKALFHSDNVFPPAFGYGFETWCVDLAREADGLGRHPSERLILPSAPGANDEIEDLVFVDGSVVVLLSAKASVVPEETLKTADQPEDGIRWLRRFFFEDAADAKKRGHRGGAVQLLDKKIQRIRAGDFESSGIGRNARIIPAVVCFDNVGESAILYKWLETEAYRKRLLSRHGDVRPLTVIQCEDFEILMALKAQGNAVCQLLTEKTDLRRKWHRLDIFLFDKFGPDAGKLRLPSVKRRYDALITGTLERLRQSG